MPQAKQENQLDLTPVTSILAGSAIALAVSMAVLALTAWLIAEGRLGEDWSGRVGLIAAFLGCLIGGGYGVHTVGKRALPVGAAVSAVFLLWWIVLKLLNPAGTGGWHLAPLAASGLLGGGLAGILFASGKKRRK